jgi:pimeloyl-ACP methyl ester carboxylesterase
MVPAPLRSGFSALSRVAPRVAGALAYRLFTTPLKTKRLSASEQRLEARAELRLRGAEKLSVTANGLAIAAYRFGRKLDGGRRIILVHGWMSGARYMLAIMEELLRDGDEVICLDLPAHGQSEGRRTNLVDCAAALDATISAAGPADLIVAHSFGGAVTAYLLERRAPNQLADDGRIILLASPNQLSAVTAGFSKAFGLTRRAQLHYEALLCKTIGATLDEMDGNIMYRAVGRPVHILHCVDDDEVSIEQSRRYRALGDQVRLTELSGLGHRRILYSPRAMAALRDAARPAV